MNQILKYLIMTLLAGVVGQAVAQQVIPESRGYRQVDEWLMVKKQLKDTESEIKNYSKILEAFAKSKGLLAHQLQEQSFIQSKVDTLNSMRQVLKDSLNVLDTLLTKVQISTTASVNVTDEISNAGAVSKLMINVWLAKSLQLAMVYNAASVRPQAVAKDSIDVVSLMFPESGNAGFIVGMEKILPLFKNLEKSDSEHRLSLSGEFSFRQSKFKASTADSTGNESRAATEGFSALNYNLALRYRFKHTSDILKNDVAYFSTALYYNAFNIPNEDARIFEELLGEKLRRSWINSLGVKFSFQYKSWVLYADFRQNLNTGLYSDSNKLKGFVYNIGTIVNADIFRF